MEMVGMLLELPIEASFTVSCSMFLQTLFRSKQKNSKSQTFTKNKLCVVYIFIIYYFQPATLSRVQQTLCACVTACAVAAACRHAVAVGKPVDDSDGHCDEEADKLTRQYDTNTHQLCNIVVGYLYLAVFIY